MTVAALFVDMKGHYPALVGPENCWDEKRDARLYYGPSPVVAHPPCFLWGPMANVNYARYKDRSPQHEFRLRPGNDQGCFASALQSVRRYGGVLEHPAYTRAWPAHNLMQPRLFNDYGDRVGWERHNWSSIGPCRALQSYWVCRMSQCAYGNRARKRTDLLYCGQKPPFDLDWSEPEYTHQIGNDAKQKNPRPTLDKREASATPIAFAKTLIALAEWSRG